MLSVIVIAKNAGETIRLCLDSVRFAQEIIVLDSGSEDDTVAVARACTPHVFQTDWPGFGLQKQRALLRATGDWVLNLDADEVVDEPLRAAVVAAIAQRHYTAYRVPIRMCFYGKPLRFSASPKRHIRLFKREGASFSPDLVHEKIQLPADAVVGRLPVPIWHHSFRDLSHALRKVNMYSSYSAQMRIQEQCQASVSKSLASSCWMFLRCYILQGGFLDGKPGLVLALLQAQGSWYRGIKQLYRDNISL